MKERLHIELKLRYREFFESAFAVTLLENLDHFPSVKKVSRAILGLIQESELQVIQVIERKTAIVDELSFPYFGACFQENTKPRAEAMVTMIKTVLSDPKASLAKVMQLHAIFIYRIYDELKTCEIKEDGKRIIFDPVLFSQQKESRTEVKKENIMPTYQQGFVRNPVWAKRIKLSESQHQRAIDKFSINTQGAFFQALPDKSIPVVCGPSGHTGSFMLGAVCYGDLNVKELNEYAWACFAFLASGGNHSFYEVMIVAKLAGASLNPSHYAQSMPFNIKNTFFYQDYIQQFPEFLSEDISEKKNYTD